MSEGKDLVPAGARREIDEFRARGAHAVAKQQAVADLEIMIAGHEWGSGNQAIKGSAMSPATKAAFAHFCAVARANPQLHVDLLGGKPYLNVNYWVDRCSADPSFIDDDQLEIGADAASTLRRRAAELRSASDLAEEPQRKRDLMSRAIEQELAAEDIEDLRAKWKVPVWAKVAYVTRIRRFIEAAPLNKIREGEIEVAPWMIAVREECNWAGGRPLKTFKKGEPQEYTKQTDPIGEEEPEKTARSRSYRRAARKAFPAWMDAFESQLQKAEQVLEAEWVEVRDQARATRELRPDLGGPVALTSGSGEPEAVRSTAAAQELPVRGREVGREAFSNPPSTKRQEPPKATAAAAPRQEPAQLPAGDAEEEYDQAAASRRYFAILRNVGITKDDDRKAWQKKHGLDGSTTGWSPVTWRRALSLVEAEEAARSQEPEDEGGEPEGQEDAPAAAEQPTQPGDLPFDEPSESAEDANEGAGAAPAEPEKPAFDAVKAKADLVVAVKYAGLADKASWKTWTSRNGFPEKLPEWTEDHYGRAAHLLVKQMRGAFVMASRQVGKNPEWVEDAIGMQPGQHPETLSDYARAFEEIAKHAPGGET